MAEENVTTGSCRVLIADDHSLVRNALRQLLEGIAGVSVVGEAEDGLAAIAKARKLQPDLLMLDVSMPGAGGLAVIGEIGRWSPTTRVVVVTGVTSMTTLAEFVRSGAIGVLLKSATPQELSHGLRQIVAGGTYVAAELRQALDGTSPIATLTTRERQVLSLAAKGHSNSQIAALLNISAKTADNHRTNVMRKLAVHSAAELTALAMREDLA
jgi:DNA-binding NarL/FixJ family response regulator